MGQKSTRRMFRMPSLHASDCRRDARQAQASTEATRARLVAAVDAARTQYERTKHDTAITAHRIASHALTRFDAATKQSLGAGHSEETGR
jgi:hypothetical protein